jgi:hypothetical protein
MNSSEELDLSDDDSSDISTPSQSTPKTPSKRARIDGIASIMSQELTESQSAQKQLRLESTKVSELTREDISFLLSCNSLKLGKLEVKGKSSKVSNSINLYTKLICM